MLAQVALGAGVVAVGAYALNRLLKPYVVLAYDRCCAHPDIAFAWGMICWLCTICPLTAAATRLDLLGVSNSRAGHCNGTMQVDGFHRC